ncbi:hypothetical protein A4S05_01800 [Nostoc sp. KVJ20]|uniref:hypothetical protein n=1 Tax=Nostoc sp. KVJ20 TaxID=457944 RepID=UPI00083DF262|nr:hypothetical protein [Nostoc sp. KVJ20]ODG97142.1 hypothetical protein A4S05_01800 [Nostoc sp. KVJ20]
MKLQRIEAGEYLTPDGRFYVRNTYYSNGIPGRSNTSSGWLIEDKSGATPFQRNHHKSNLRRVDTLTEAREIITLVIECDRKEKTLLSAGWCKEDNPQQPGVCWLSPYTGKLLTRSEALLELSLMSS